jgi:hypothetical protein
MEPKNAFIGKATPPEPAEITAALGETAALWQKLIDWLATEKGVSEVEWKGVYPNKYGWSARLKLKKRTIVYMGPCNGCFRVALVLGDRAVAAAKDANLPKSLLKSIEEARRYAEGTWIYIVVRRTSQLSAIHKLVEIKLAN